jgi:Fe-S cluster assembly protein SufD
MTGLTEQHANATRGVPAWLAGIRREALARFDELGLPTTHDEDWKYTNVSAIGKTAFQPGASVPADLSAFRLADLGCGTRLVFVNGRFSKELSSAGRLARGVIAGSLAELVRDGDGTPASHLARYAGFEKHAFVAWNTALLQDGALVEFGRDAAPEEPVHLVYLSVPNGKPTASHPRNLIIAGPGCQAAVIETYVGAPGVVYFTNVVTEVLLDEGAALDHYRVQVESEAAYHVATVQGVQKRQSVLNSHNVSLGGLLTRNDVNSVLDAEGAECFLNGLYVARGRQHVDNHTMLDHAKPHCSSRELYKGVLDGRGVGVFNGKIVVRKDAQKTNAIQSNRNLLLSEGAVVNTKPQLEIFADDVRCTHGATVGQLDREAQFYLQSRGIPAGQARDLLTYAFAGEVLDQIRWRPLRERLTSEIHKVLSPNGGGALR